jgi:hypothetical protein
MLTASSSEGLMRLSIGAEQGQELHAKLRCESSCWPVGEGDIAGGLAGRQAGRQARKNAGRAQQTHQFCYLQGPRKLQRILLFVFVQRLDKLQMIAASRPSQAAGTSGQ